MTINITHRGMELTDANRLYAEEKFGTLEKYGRLLQRIDVELGKTTDHHKNGNIFLCHAEFHLKDGRSIRMEREANDLYKAIEKVRDHVKVELAELKQASVDERRRQEERAEV